MTRRPAGLDPAGSFEQGSFRCIREVEPALRRKVTSGRDSVTLTA
jgi:hypothetical protein